VPKAASASLQVRATYEVIDWLFGDGQTALRQAMTAVAQAAAITPQVVTPATGRAAAQPEPAAAGASGAPAPGLGGQAWP
jgi:hypothetical protein